jgi:hypothetical protein
MPEDGILRISGKAFNLVSQSMLPAGKRAWSRRQRPTEPSDPGIPQVARWIISGPQGNSRENVTQGAGLLSVDWAEGMDTLYDALLLPGPKVSLIDLITLSQSTYVETVALESTTEGGDSATGNTGTGTVAWADASNVLVDDTAAATATGPGTTNELRVLLGANANRIPSGGTVAGFTLRLRKRATAASAWTVIDSETLAAPASSISFTGIDTTYKMFRVTAYLIQDGSAGRPLLRLNNDSGTNYDWQRVSASDTTVSASRVTGDTSIDIGGDSNANQVMTHTITIAKQLAGSPAMVVGDRYNDAGIWLRHHGARWNNTADLISRIDLIASAGNFAAGTVVVLEAA